MNTKWYKWNKRNDIQDRNLPGIYFLAHTDKDISGEEFSLINEIIYIGVTISNIGLKGRLDQFEYTMRTSSSGNHGGAQRVRVKHKNADIFFQNLYISVFTFPVSKSRNTPNDLRIKGECLKHEYISFAEYLEKHGRLPEFNDHNRSKKK